MIKREALQEFGRIFVATVVVSVLFLMLAWAAGITPDGVLYGHWSDTDDHPTNWNDPAQHLEAH